MHQIDFTGLVCMKRYLWQPRCVCCSPVAGVVVYFSLFYFHSDRDACYPS